MKSSKEDVKNKEPKELSVEEKPGKKGKVVIKYKSLSLNNQTLIFERKLITNSFGKTKLMKMRTNFDVSQ